MALELHKNIAKPALHKQMKFSIMNFSSKCDQIRSFLRVWSHLLKKSLMENFICCEMVPIFIMLVFTLF